MLITRGLGSGLLITQGLGLAGAPAPRVYPYYPTESAYLSAPVLVQVVNNPFSRAVSMVLTAQPSYEDIPSPYSVAAGELTEAVNPIEVDTQPVVEGTEVISNTPTPHTELPQRSE